MTKHNGKYYLQYASPATQFNTYCDGVYVADAPLGPFTLQQSNPFSSNRAALCRARGMAARYRMPMEISGTPRPCASA